MKRLIEGGRYISWIAVAALGLGSLVAFLWGAVRAAEVAWTAATSIGHDAALTLHLVELVDTFLLAIVLYVFAASVYELFLGGLKLPEWMLARNLDQLKVKLSNVIILVLAVRFLEQFIEGREPRDLLMLAGSVALVSAVLVAFAHFGARE
jgi:uncharacterized membrane protein YqhA